MSKIIINWEKNQIIKNNNLNNVIKLINYSKSIFLSDHKLSFAINNFIVKKYIYYEFKEDDFIIHYFGNNNNKNTLSYQEIFDILKQFFNKTIFIILKNFHSLMISEKNYLNVYYKKNIINIYLDSYPITSVFKISHLKNEPFNYEQIQIDVIEKAMLFLDEKMKNNNTMIKIWGFYFFFIYNKDKAAVVDNELLNKINENIKDNELIVNSINYDAIIYKLLKN